MILVSLACSSKKIERENPSNEFLPGVKLAELKNKRLSEVSGMVASAANPGYLWVLNDSQNGNQVFLIDEKYDIKLTCPLANVENRDWEDIAVGPGPDSTKTYVYVAEIGDNDAKYPYKYIYRFEEPTLSEGARELPITSFDTITFTLAGKQKDSEALLLDPKTKDLYIISKREQPVFIYKLTYPYSTKDTIAADEVGSLPLTQIVAADFSSDRSEILMKNYEHVYYWTMLPGKSVVESLQQKPKELAYEEEPQGESITWARDGSGYYTTSELNKGEKSYLIYYARRK
jgi:hypothetical protein